jgi:simple sugar transport system ATP-binding protein
MESLDLNKNVVEMRNITKRFTNVVANNDVTFLCSQSKISALVGENGAGKSTLMNILYGLIQSDAGEIFLENGLVRIHNPGDAIRLGIGMVHQNFMLSPNATVLDNITLGYEPKNWIFTDRKKAKKAVLLLMEEYNFDLPLEIKIKNLPVGLKQRAEILKLLYRGASILILDEPTAVLTPQETEALFINLRSLIKIGKTIIFITHKLDEVMEISDEVHVMRNGKMVAHRYTSSTNTNEIAELMVGREIVSSWNKVDLRKKEVFLKVSNLYVKNDQGNLTINDLSLDVLKGEILGLAGVSGNGQPELATSLVGLRKSLDGKIQLLEKRIENYNRRRTQDLGISYIPDDRTEVGLSLNQPVKENLIAGNHLSEPISKGFLKLLNKKAITKISKDLVKQFDIRLSSIEDPAKSLSGGNQQKVVLAREIHEIPNLLIAFEPTRGVDIGAIEFIYKELLALRDKGTTILLISSDLDEIFALSDRIGVIFRGKILAILDTKKTCREDIGLLMAGNTSRLGK